MVWCLWTSSWWWCVWWALRREVRSMLITGNRNSGWNLFQCLLYILGDGLLGRKCTSTKLTLVISVSENVWNLQYCTAPWQENCTYLFLSTCSCIAGSPTHQYPHQGSVTSSPVSCIAHQWPRPPGPFSEVCHLSSCSSGHHCPWLNRTGVQAPAHHIQFETGDHASAARWESHPVSTDHHSLIYHFAGGCCCWHHFPLSIHR